MSAPAQLTIRSRLFPTIIIPVGAGGGAAPNVGGAARIVLGIVQPAVDVDIAGQRLTTIAPAGNPGPSLWPAFRLVLLGLGIVIAVKLIL